MSHIRPLQDEELGKLTEQFEPTIERLGFVPNSQRVMAHKPELLEGFVAMTRGVQKQTDQSIPMSLKYMIANAASLAAGCMYCVAHTGAGTSRAGVDDDKIAAIWDYENSDHFTDAEKAALRFAQAAAAVPNAVTVEDFGELRKHFTEYQIVEMVGVVAMFGFLNRWNDTMATSLESEPVAFAEQTLSDRGWDGGKHMVSAQQAAE